MATSVPSVTIQHSGCAPPTRASDIIGSNPSNMTISLVEFWLNYIVLLCTLSREDKNRYAHGDQKDEYLHYRQGYEICRYRRRDQNAHNSDGFRSFRYTFVAFPIDQSRTKPAALMQPC